MELARPWKEHRVVYRKGQPWALSFLSYINDMYRAVGPENVRLRRWIDIIYEPLRPTYTHRNNKTQIMPVVQMVQIMNSDKTYFVLFHAIKKLTPTDFTGIKTEYMDIQRVETFQYHGVTLEKNLNWNEHVDKLRESLLKYL